MAGAGPRAGASPTPFGGVPLGRTGLRLVVAGNPPFTLVVDAGIVRTIQVPGLHRDASTWVRRVGPNVALVESPSCADCLNGEAFFLRPGDAVASPLGSAFDAALARKGDGVWLLRLASRRAPHRERISSAAGTAWRRRRHGRLVTGEGARVHGFELLEADHAAGEVERRTFTLDGIGSRSL